MKHIVKLTVSNPSHDFISMRGKTKQQDYITEARDESEAINRAARHFRALGFKVHSAVIVEQKVEIPEPVALAEAVDYKALEKPTIARIKSGETKPADRTNYNVPPGMRKKPIDKKAALEAFIARRKETVTEEAAPQYIEEKLTAADPAAKWIHDFVHSDNPEFNGKSKEERIRMALGAKYASKRRAEGVAEEVEQIDEESIHDKVEKHNAKVSELNRSPKFSVGDWDHPDLFQRAPKGYRFHMSSHLIPSNTEGFPIPNKKKAIGGVKEEVEQIEEADIKSKPVMHKGKEIGETGIDSEASPGNGKWYAKHHKSGMDSLGFDSRREAEAEVKYMHGFHKAQKFLNSMKKKDVKEAADPGKIKVVNKEVKTNKAAAAADKIVKVSKSKVNKVNMDPELNQDVKQSSRY